MQSHAPSGHFSEALTVFVERSRELPTELFRKSIHILVGAVPLLAALNYGLTKTLLVCGIMVFLYSEKVRLAGGSLPFITAITNRASRARDRNKMVLGPLTLGLGALFTLVFFQEPTASVGIFALAFGDGLASVTGKLFGRIKIPFTKGKTLIGTLTVFLVVLPVALAAGGSLYTSLIVALGAATLEALPLEDLDNLILPLGTAFLFNFLR